MHLFERSLVLHRAWRYRLRTERDEIRFLLRRELAGSTVVDIGANRGIYSYWMHKLVGPRGRVVAFEPQPELAQYLASLRGAFHLDRLEIVNSALSSTAGQTTLRRPIGHWGGGTIVRQRMAAGMEALSVAVTTLDEFFAKQSLPRVSFIKCDVEGHEYEVFQGGRQVLDKDRPDLLFECHDLLANSGKLFRYLSEMGYAGYFFVKHALVPIAELPNLRATIRKPYLNYIFTHRERTAPRVTRPVSEKQSP